MTAPLSVSPITLTPKSILHRLFYDVLWMPRWHKAVLGMALAVTTFGFIHKTYSTLVGGGPDASQTAVSSGSAAGSGSAQAPASSNGNPQGSVNQGAANQGSANQPADTSGMNSDAATTPQWSRRVGSSVLLGFIIGWAFRTFLKVMSAVSAAVLAGFFLISYFNIFHVNMGAVEQQSTDVLSWCTAQATHLRDAALAHSHSTVGSVTGLYIGARKKLLRPLAAAV
jgi:uncharacterized membrane protein (Fun14 family)